MDPNEALRLIREAIKRMQAASHADDYTDAASDLADAVQALDEWLTRGGFLPEEWHRNRKPGPWNGPDADMLNSRSEVVCCTGNCSICRAARGE